MHTLQHYRQTKEDKRGWIVFKSQSESITYNYCQATEPQIQEYLSGKYECFLADVGSQEYPVKIAAQAVGLQYIDEDDTTV